MVSFYHIMSFKLAEVHKDLSFVVVKNCDLCNAPRICVSIGGYSYPILCVCEDMINGNGTCATTAMPQETVNSGYNLEWMQIAQVIALMTILILQIVILSRSFCRR